ncbi:hypothetical protein E4T56_gene3009 [Termitomyces sp. T112]|nr:hypothetical protein C0989_010813 [Termitomyces sp. Mn162]KAG5715226.1 hypothetical protein E4T56_gene3009 [Termitomyces sp. T112]KAH0587164.1 hypothetical protein H2248_005973 [Termitomyces sp. 'cryptogamus']
MSGLGLRLTSSSAARCSSAVLRFQLRPRGSRSIHKRKTLPYPIEGGLGNFLPPEALKVVAVDYQEGLLKRLDEEVRGSPEAVEDIAQTVLNTACSKERTLAFNYASLALNNDYFLNQLMPLPTEGSLKNHQNEISAHLATNIREQYGTLIQLKSAFSSAVMGMFTSGSVWFVTDRSGRLGIIPTFGPGTLLFRSRMYMGQPDVRGPSLGQLEPTVPYVHAQWDGQGSGATEEEIIEDLENDMRPLRSPTGSRTSPTAPSPSSPVSGVSGGKQPLASPNALHPRFPFSTSAYVEDYSKKADNVWTSDNTKYRPAPQSKAATIHLGETLFPLFCISVNEHAWMAAGYGVWGKEAWLKEFWTVLDWKKVSQAYERISPGIKVSIDKVD